MSRGNLGRRFTDEHRRKISEALKGRSPSLESREKTRAALKGRPAPWVRDYMTGRKRGPRSEEAKRKQSLAMRGRTLTPEHRAKLSTAKQGKTQPNIRRAIASNVGRRLTEKHKATLSAVKKGRPGRPQSKETIEKRIGGLRGRPLSLEHRAKLSATKKGRPLSDAHKRALTKAWSKHPNKFERRVLDVLIDSDPGAGWKFNDGLVIAGKIPDFIRADDLNLVVDAHGDYWHREETDDDVKARQRLFADAGYRLIVVWEREFNADPQIIVRRVHEFVNPWPVPPGPVLFAPYEDA